MPSITTNESSMPERIAGAISGNVMVNRMRTALAPETSAASSSAGSMLQRRRGEHVDVGRIVDAEDRDHPFHRVGIETEVGAGPFDDRVDEAGLRRREDRP